MSNLNSNICMSCEISLKEKEQNKNKRKNTPREEMNNEPSIQYPFKCY